MSSLLQGFRPADWEGLCYVGVTFVDFVDLYMFYFLVKYQKMAKQLVSDKFLYRRYN